MGAHHKEERRIVWKLISSSMELCGIRGRTRKFSYFFCCCDFLCCFVYFINWMEMKKGGGKEEGDLGFMDVGQYRTYKITQFSGMIKKEKKNLGYVCYYKPNFIIFYKLV